MLARPTRGGNIRPSFIDRTGVWDQPGVTEASAYEIPPEEYEDWAARPLPRSCSSTRTTSSTRSRGCGRWARRPSAASCGRRSRPATSPPAKRAFDLIYSLTECEQRRYAELGIDSPKVDWGCHPELLAIEPRRDPETVTFMYPGGFMSKRKPFEAVIEAFSSVEDPRLRLVFKAQVERRVRKVEKLVKRDPRIEVIWEDLPTDAYLQLFADSDVCLAPSRWEGLGLHLYEATAFGMPIVTNDNPPMNEIVTDGVNGLLVPGHRERQGEVRDPGLRAGRRRAGRRDPAARRRRAARRAVARRPGDARGLSWDRTVPGYAGLIERVAPARQPPVRSSG